jgi:hypothetical protein
MKPKKELIKDRKAFALYLTKAEDKTLKDIAGANNVSVQNILHRAIASYFNRYKQTDGKEW